MLNWIVGLLIVGFVVHQYNKNPRWFYQNLIRNRFFLWLPAIYYWGGIHLLGMEWLWMGMTWEKANYFCSFFVGGYFCIYWLSRADWMSKFHSPHYLNKAVRDSYVGKVFPLGTTQDHILIQLGGVSTPDGEFLKGNTGCIISPSSNHIRNEVDDILDLTDLTPYYDPNEVPHDKVRDWLLRHPDDWTRPIWYGEALADDLSHPLEVPSFKVEIIKDDQNRIIDRRLVLDEDGNKVVTSLEAILNENIDLRRINFQQRQLLAGNMSMLTEIYGQLKSVDSFPSRTKTGIEKMIARLSSLKGEEEIEID